MIIKPIDDEYANEIEGLDFEWTPLELSSEELTIKVDFDDPSLLSEGFESKYELVLIFWDPVYFEEKLDLEIPAGFAISSQVEG